MPFLDRKPFRMIHFLALQPDYHSIKFTENNEEAKFTVMD